MKHAFSWCILIIMTSLSIYKGAMTPARACYRSPCVIIKVGGGQFREPVLAVSAGRAAPTAPLPSLAVLGEPLCTSV